MFLVMLRSTTKIWKSTALNGEQSQNTKQSNKSSERVTRIEQKNEKFDCQFNSLFTKTSRQSVASNVIKIDINKTMNDEYFN